MVSQASQLCTYNLSRLVESSEMSSTTHTGHCLVNSSSMNRLVSDTYSFTSTHADIDTSACADIDTSTGADIDTSTGADIDTSACADIDTSTGADIDKVSSLWVNVPIFFLISQFVFKI